MPLWMCTRLPIAMRLSHTRSSTQESQRSTCVWEKSGIVFPPAFSSLTRSELHVYTCNNSGVAYGLHLIVRRRGSLIGYFVVVRHSPLIDCVYNLFVGFQCSL